MKLLLKHWLQAAVAGVAALVLAAPASAQVVNPYFRLGLNPYGYGGGMGVPGPIGYNPVAAQVTNNPYLGTQAALVTNPNLSPYSTPGVPDPYLTNAYTNPYLPYYNPVAGFLNGIADVTTANANATLTIQRARLVQEDVFRSQLDTRRKIWDEARYERMSLMNSQQVRQANIQTALDRARRQPPLAEIWSGQSLNDLFNHLAEEQGKGLKGPTIPLNEDALKHINLTNGVEGNGNAGLLKSEIRWPATLLRPEFDELRKNLDKQIQEAVGAAKFGQVEQSLVANIKNNVAKLQELLVRNINEIKPEDYIPAKRYLNRLDDAAKALGDTNVQNYFNDKWAAKGKTVGELVENVTKQGLKFAPAAPGDEWAYTALHHAMNAYDAGITQQILTTPKP